MRLFVLLLVFALFACASEENSEFAALEKEVSEAPTNENISELLAAYAAWLTDNPDITPERQEVLTKSSSLAKKHLRYANQLNTLRTLMLEYPGDTAMVSLGSRHAFHPGQTETK